MIFEFIFLLTVVHVCAEVDWTLYGAGECCAVAGDVWLNVVVVGVV
jgi:hypothetical protein